MRWLLIAAVLLGTAVAGAQMSPQVPEDLSPAGTSTSTTDALPAAPSEPIPDSLPDSPGEVITQQENVVVVGEAALKASGNTVEPCGVKDAIGFIYINPNLIYPNPDSGHGNEVHQPCSELVYPYQRFLNTNVAIPLTRHQKGYLALHEISDPGNLATIAGISGITIGADSHTSYGPGLKGFGKIAGTSLLQDTTGEFFGTFLIPSLIHQDPRYYRMPNATIRRRLVYSISRTFVSRSDSGKSIPNYGTLLTYPISAEISNLYVPGIHTDGPSTGKRIAIGLALDPVGNLITEFVPDLAKRVHVRVIFVQQILNKIANSQGSLP